MAETKTKALATRMSEDTLAELREAYPVEQGMQRIILPRISMASQDKTEGKGKAMKVITEAGTFFTEHQTDEEDENGKKVWEKSELGMGFEGTILFQRKQLRMFDEATEEFSSTPVYDSEDEVLPLFRDKKEVERGTPAELKALYQYKDERTGKMKSKLEDNRILYILAQLGDDEEPKVYQLNLRGSSMYAFLTYAKKVLPPTVVTAFGSEAKEKGSIAWNQMTFEAVKPLSEKEGKEVVAKVKEIRLAVSLEKGQYVAKNEENEKADLELKELAGSASKAGKDF